MQTLCDTMDAREERWRLLSAFAEHFLRPFTSADCVPVREIVDCQQSMRLHLPEALVEFYALCGNARDIWCRQDEWLKPTKLRWVRGVLVFWVESQGNWNLGIRRSDLSLGDPPVVWDAASWIYGAGEPDEFTVLAESVSTFALRMIAYVAQFYGQSWERPFGRTDDADQLIGLLRQRYALCHLQDLWVCGNERYFQDSETFLSVHEDSGFVYPIFKTLAAVDKFCFLIAGIQFEWEQAPIRS